MPFISQERRKAIDNYEKDMLPLSPGDRCYVFYKEMVHKWKENPRWATAHEIYKNISYENEDLKDFSLEDWEGRYGDDFVARRLAWQVFFQFYVIPYEIDKLKQSGNI